jgi:hypothetical protein
LPMLFAEVLPVDNQAADAGDERLARVIHIDREEARSISVP